MSYLRRLCCCGLPSVLLSACVVAPPHYGHSRVVSPVVVSQPAPVVVQQPMPQMVVAAPAPRVVVPVAPAPVMVSPAPTVVIRSGYATGGYGYGHHHHHGRHGWR